MKTLAVLASILVGSLLAIPQAHAGKVGKLAGNYSGSGEVIDKRSSPISTYKYTFSNLQVKVKGNGKITGTATATASISSGGGPFFPIATSPVSASGAVTEFKKTPSKISGTGTVTFSDGTTVSGKFSVAAKTGKGSFKVNLSTPEYDANFKVSKAK